jgi:copper chaperone CopZ
MSYMVELPYEEPVGVYRESDLGYSRSVYNSQMGYDGSYGRPYHSNAVALHVSMCCEKCVQKVRKSLKNVEDVDSVEVDMPRQRVIVRGYVSPERVLRKVRKAKKSAEFWDSSHDYATYSSGAYDRYRPSMSAYDQDYYRQSSSYDYSYPSSYDYPGYSDQQSRSYDAYLYR